MYISGAGGDPVRRRERQVSVCARVRLREVEVSVRVEAAAAAGLRVPGRFEFRTGERGCERASGERVFRESFE